MSVDDLPLRTAHPPAARPVLVWDGACGFCRRAVDRIVYRVGDRIETAPYQDAADRFPDVPRERFHQAVHLIDTDGRVHIGADAIWSAFALGPGGGLGRWCYVKLPGFAAASELGYRFVASHRSLMSRVTRWFIGPDLLPRQFRLTRWVYLRLLALAALCAFVSLYVQMDGLFSSHGISPAADFMSSLRSYADGHDWGALRRFAEVPTLGWMSASDGALHAYAIAGIVASVLLLFDVAAGWMVAALWLLYLSLVNISGTFFQFQWDTLLLEALFVSMFVAPWRLRPALRGDREPSLAGVWLVRLLLFKLMFLSGAVKLMAHGDTWTSLSALDVHFFTQPLPTWTAYYAHFAPHWVHAIALLVTFAIELAMPWLVFGPRRARLAFGFSAMFLMLMIGLTGNYGFFNLLAFSIAVMCLDDTLLRRFVPRRLRARIPDPTVPPARVRPRWQRRASWVAASMILVLSAQQMLFRVDRKSELGRSVSDVTSPFLSNNSYGLFQDMTTSRPEIIIEGSRDGTTWQAYEFKYKPGDLDRRPRFTGPFMPRLDWQMWFAALEGCEASGWFQSFVAKLFEAEPDVRALLARDPFGADPPRYIRTTLYDYTFADPDAHGWWTRSNPRPFCPVYRRE